MAKPRTSSDGKIQKRQERPEATLVALLQRMGPEIARALPKHIDPDRMGRIALTALRTVPKLALCTAPSFMGCVIQAAQLGLEVNTPLQHAWLIPRKNRGHMECTIVIGYQGMIELALRSGLVTGMFSYVVREGDDFQVRLGIDPHIHHIPSPDPARESKPITYVYAVAKIKNGEPIFVALSRPQVEARRARSDGYAYQVKKGGRANPWFTDEEAMFQKTALRALWKWLPKSAEMASAARVEEAADTERTQSTGFDPDVTDILTANGLDAIDTEGEDVTHEEETPPEADPENGEMTADEERAAFGDEQAKTDAEGGKS